MKRRGFLRGLLGAAAAMPAAMPAAKAVEDHTAEAIAEQCEDRQQQKTGEYAPIGAEAMKEFTTLPRNTFIGYQCGRAIDK